MRFIIFLKSTPGCESDPASQAVGADSVTALAAYHEQLARAGVLLYAARLQPSDRGWRVRCEGGRCTVIEGPFAEMRELVCAFTIIETRTREEAMEWSRRFPGATAAGQTTMIEVRALCDVGDAMPMGPAHLRVETLAGR